LPAASFLLRLGFRPELRVSGVKMCDSKHCLVLPDFGRFGPVRQFDFYNLVDVWAFLEGFFSLGFLWYVAICN
jgi:hypothetical protein